VATGVGAWISAVSEGSIFSVDFTFSSVSRRRGSCSCNGLDFLLHFHKLGLNPPNSFPLSDPVPYQDGRNHESTYANASYSTLIKQ
jgi:hypothetical protein